MTTRSINEKHCLNDLASAIHAWSRRTKKDIKICISANAKSAVIFGNVAIHRTTEGNKSIWYIEHKNKSSQPTEDQWLKTPEQFENLKRGREINRLLNDLHLHQTVDPNVRYRQYRASDLKKENRGDNLTIMPSSVYK